MRVVDEATVARILDPQTVRRLMGETFVAAAAGRAHGPVRAVLQPKPGAWMAAMPAFVATPSLRGLGAKIVTAYPGNAALGKATHLATVLLVDADDGSLRGLVAAETITERRTAALSVIATERLARRPQGRYAILGAGAQARAHLEAFAAAGFIERLTLWSRTPEHASALLDPAAGIGIAAETAASPDLAVLGADVIVTATASVDPLFDAASVAEGAHCNAVGSSVPARAELPAALIAQSAVYVESREAARREAGDLIRARAAGVPQEALITGELGEMLANPERTVPRTRNTIFKSVGVGIADVACAAYVLAALEGCAGT